MITFVRSCKQEPRNFDYLLDNGKLHNLERLLGEGFNFDEIRPGRLRGKQAVATLNLGSISEFA
jgi:hypothetical protein